MHMMLDVPDAINAQVAYYESATGKSVSQMLVDCLQKEIDRIQNGNNRVANFRDLLSRQTPLSGEPYKFNRQDAYEDPIA